MSGLSDSKFKVNGNPSVGFTVSFVMGDTIFTYWLTYAQYLRFLRKRSDQSRYKLLAMWKLRGELS